MYIGRPDLCCNRGKSLPDRQAANVHLSSVAEKLLMYPKLEVFRNAMLMFRLSALAFNNQEFGVVQDSKVMGKMRSSSFFLVTVMCAIVPPKGSPWLLLNLQAPQNGL